MNLVYLAYRLFRKSLRLLSLDILVLRYPRDFEQDGLSTSRLRPFDGDRAFEEAKRKVIKLLGRDYGIDWRTHVFLWAIRAVSGRAGCFVELGTGRGWMFQFAFNYLGPDVIDGDVYLCDRFSPSHVDPVGGKLIGGINPFYANSAEEVALAFSSFPQAQLVQGDLPESLKAVGRSDIKFVHVDLNAARPEYESLEFLWPMILPGAMILLDDFGQPEFVESNRLMREFAARFDCSVLGLPTGQGLIIKP